MIRGSVISTRPCPRGGQTFLLRRITLDIAAASSSRSWGRRSGEVDAPLGARHARRAWTGEYMLHDQLVHKLDNKRRAPLHKQYVGFVFQHTPADDLTSREPRRAALLPRHQKSERQSIVADTLTASAWWRRRISIPPSSPAPAAARGRGRAMIHKPSLILADEPTGNLHSSQAKEIMELFKRLNGAGTTIIQARTRKRTPSTATGSST